MAQYGSKKDISQLCKLINAKLSTFGEEATAFPLIDRIREINNKDFNMIKGTLEIISMTKFSDDDREGIISKLETVRYNDQKVTVH